MELALCTGVCRMGPVWKLQTELASPAVWVWWGVLFHILVQLKLESVPARLCLWQLKTNTLNAFFLGPFAV